MGCHSYDPVPLSSIRRTPRFLFKEIYLREDTTPIPLPQYTDDAYSLIVTQPRKGKLIRRLDRFWAESVPSYVPPATYRTIPGSYDYLPFDTIPYQLAWDSAGIPMELNSQLIVKARPSL